MSEGRKPLRGRIDRGWMFAGLVILAAVFTLVIQPAFSHWRGEVERGRMEARFFADLARGGTIEDLTRAVGPGGTVARTRGGDWVAIAYEDAHGGRINGSIAVARDSDGNWYTCDKHFCGGLSNDRKPAGPQERSMIPMHFVWDIEDAGDIRAARAILEGEGFRSLDPPPDVVAVRE